MKKLSFIITFLLCYAFTFAQVKVEQIQPCKGPFGEAEGCFIVTDANGEPHYATCEGSCLGDDYILQYRAAKDGALLYLKTLEGVCATGVGGNIVITLSFPDGNTTEYTILHENSDGTTQQQTFVDTYTTTFISTTTGTDVFNQTFNVGDNIIMTPGGPVCIPPKGAGEVTINETTNVAGDTEITINNGTDSATFCKETTLVEATATDGGITDDGTTVSACRILLDRDMAIQPNTTEGEIANSISTSFADAVENESNIIAGVTTYDNQLVLAARNATITGGSQTIVAGWNNTAATAFADNSFMTGFGNYNEDSHTIMYGASNRNEGLQSQASIIGGSANTNTSLSGIGGSIAVSMIGINNIFDGSQSSMGGGENNTYINSLRSTLVGLGNNVTNATNSFSGGNNNTVVDGIHSILNGNGNTSLSVETSFVNGLNNNTDGLFASYLNGLNQDVSMTELSDINGRDHVITDTKTSIFSGSSHTATGTQFSAIFGNNTLTTHTNTFLFNATAANTLTTTAPRQFMVSASGGVFFYTDPAATFTTGVSLATSASAWASVSARKFKEDFTPINYMDVYERFKNYEVTKWRYKGADFYNVGMMADDFYELFPTLGTQHNQEKIETTDGIGAAMILIKAQAEKIEKLERRIEKIEK